MRVCYELWGAGFAVFFQRVSDNFSPFLPPKKCRLSRELQPRIPYKRYLRNGRLSAEILVVTIKTIKENAVSETQQKQNKYSTSAV